MQKKDCLNHSLEFIDIDEGQITSSFHTLETLTICATKSIWDSFPLKSQKNPSCIEIKSKSPENLCKKEFFSKELNSKDFQHEPSIFTFHPKGDFSNYEQKKELEKQTVFDKILKNIIQNEPRKFIFNPKISNEVYTEHIKQILNGLKKAKHILNPPSLEYQKKNSIKLNSKSGSKIIFFELQDILIINVAKSQNNDFFILNFGDDKTNFEKIFYKIRPFFYETFNVLCQYYEIYIYSSMAKQVVSKIVAHLDPKNTIFKGFLSNKKCLKTKSSFYIKDLRIIADKNLKDMIIIDSNPFSFSFTLDNGIPILPWHGNADDCELPFLVSYLIKQTKYVNFQNEIAKNFKLSELAKSLNKAIITQT